MTNKAWIFSCALFIGLSIGAITSYLSAKRTYAPTTTPIILVTEYWRGVNTSMDAITIMQSNLAAGIDRTQAKNEALAYRVQQETNFHAISLYGKPNKW